MPIPKFKNSLPSAGPSPAITPLHELPPELLRKLQDKGINPASLQAELEAEQVLGISHASGPSEHQAELDAWVDSGGVPDFAD